MRAPRSSVITCILLACACSSQWAELYPPSPPPKAYAEYLTARLLREDACADSGPECATPANAEAAQLQQATLQQALAAIERAIGAAPNDDALYIEKADLLRLSQRAQEGLELLDAIHAKTQHAHLVRALCYESIGNSERAINTLITLLKQQPGFHEASFALARIAIEEHQLEHARWALEELRKSRPDFARAWLASANLAFETERYDEASEYYEAYLLLDARSELAFLRLAKSYEILGDPLGREETLDDCIAFISGSITCKSEYVSAASVLQGPLSSDGETLLLALFDNTTDPSPNFLLELGLRILQFQSFPVYAELTEHILLQQPRLDTLRLALVKRLILDNEVERAAKLSPSFDPSSPQFRQAEIALAFAYALSGQAQTAIDRLELLLNTHQQPELYLALAQIQRQDGRSQDARECLEIALEACTNCSEIRLALAALLESIGELELAIEHYETVATANNSSTSLPLFDELSLRALLAYARLALLRPKHRSAARTALQHSLETSSESSSVATTELLIALAMLHIQDEKLEGAQTLLSQAAELPAFVDKLREQHCALRRLEPVLEQRSWEECVRLLPEKLRSSLNESVRCVHNTE
ncbi:MAG: tetratricopeptide repeat protein [Myxococcota bacterium]|jgi:tetratricopeptide (TPR) repeat protein|nr:tetratricopeptide repeat protein [Myxococcota bacterium]